MDEDMARRRAQQLTVQSALPEFDDIVTTIHAAARAHQADAATRLYFMLNSPIVAAACVEDAVLADARAALGFRSGQWEIWNGYHPCAGPNAVFVMRPQTA